VYTAGIGAGMIVMVSIVMIYYPMVMAYALYYMFVSWQSQVPWYDCSNSFNTPCSSLDLRFNTFFWN